MPSSEAETAWLAGLLEGEGCFRVRKGYRGRRAELYLTLKMTDRDVVERAAVLLGNRVSLGTVSDPSWSQTYVTTVTGVKAEHAMLAVLPYMGTRRSAKIEECLNTPNLSHHAQLRR